MRLYDFSTLISILMLYFVNLTAPFECNVKAAPPDGSFLMEAQNRLTVVMPWLSELSPSGVTSGSAFLVATRTMKARNCTSLRWDLLALSCNHTYKVLSRASKLYVPFLRHPLR